MENDDRKLELIHAIGRDNFALAVVQNIAANGRQFSTLIFAACIAAYLKTGLAFFAVLAIVAALPLGLSVLLDRAFISEKPRRALGVAIYGLATLSAFVFVFAILIG